MKAVNFIDKIVMNDAPVVTQDLGLNKNHGTAKKRLGMVDRQRFASRVFSQQGHFRGTITNEIEDADEQIVRAIAPHVH